MNYHDTVNRVVMKVNGHLMAAKEPLIAINMLIAISGRLMTKYQSNRNESKLNGHDWLFNGYWMGGH